MRRGRAMDKYLWGIAEVPISWTNGAQEALKAQAIAARTYAAKRAGARAAADARRPELHGLCQGARGQGLPRQCRAQPAMARRGRRDLGPGRDVVVDRRADRHALHVVGRWPQRRRALSSGESRRRPCGRSTTRAGSWRRATRPRTGRGPRAFPGPRWRASSASRASAPSRCPPADRLRGSLGSRSTGIRGGAAVTTYLEGWDVRQALGLLSPGFDDHDRRTSAAPAADADRRRLGRRRHRRPRLVPRGCRSPCASPTGRAPGSSAIGSARPATCRSSATGTVTAKDDVGLFRAGTWLLRNGQTAGAADKMFAYGVAGDRPVVGRWKGTTLGIGVVRRGAWLLRTHGQRGRAAAGLPLWQGRQASGRRGLGRQRHHHDRGAARR